MVIDASLWEFSKCMIKYCKYLMTRLQSNQYMTELSLCTDTGRKWNKKATIPYTLKEINCLCLSFTYTRRNYVVAQLVFNIRDWLELSCFVEDCFCLNLWVFDSTHVFVFGIWSIALKWKKNQQMSLINQ